MILSCWCRYKRLNLHKSESAAKVARVLEELTKQSGIDHSKFYCK